MELRENGESETMAKVSMALRNTKQEIMPPTIQASVKNGYSIYPTHTLEEGVIFNGYPSLAQWIAEKRTVIIDGYVGNFWSRIAEDLTREFESQGAAVNW